MSGDNGSTGCEVTPADETQQQPEKSRYVHVRLCVCADASFNTGTQCV